MKIVQITDLHIGRENEIPHDVDVRLNFRSMLSQLSSCDMDALVITGDLCLQDGEREIYRWIKEQLSTIDCPQYFLPGNHDRTDLLVEVFELDKLASDGELYYACEWSGQPVVFLDSSSGYVSERQLTWLDRQLQRTHKDVLLFIHHPPLPMGVPYMDQQHAMKNGEQLMDVLENSGLPVTVFCGHYHVDKSCRRRNVSVHITPSCYFQIDWRYEEFQVDHLRIGYRWIELADGSIRHGVRYLDV